MIYSGMNNEIYCLSHTVVLSVIVQLLFVVYNLYASARVLLSQFPSPIALPISTFQHSSIPLKLIPDPTTSIKHFQITQPELSLTVCVSFHSTVF